MKRALVSSAPVKSAPRRTAVKVCIVQVGAPQAGVMQVGARQISPLQTGAGHVGDPQLRPAQVGTRQVCEREVGTPEIGLSELGAAEISVGERSAREGRVLKVREVALLPRHPVRAQSHEQEPAPAQQHRRQDRRDPPGCSVRLLICHHRDVHQQTVARPAPNAKRERDGERSGMLRDKDAREVRQAATASLRLVGLPTAWQERKRAYWGRRRPIEVPVNQ